MTSRLGREVFGTVAIALCLLLSSCGQKGPLYLPDDQRTAGDRAESESVGRPRSADSAMPETGISTSEIPTRIQRESPEEQLDEEGITTE
jgi:predicted small lipoprotein YifL